MATPIVHSVYGHLWLGPTTAAAGGTQLLGMDPSLPIRIVVPPGTKLERHGLERDAVRSVAMIAPPRAILALPAQGGDVNTLKLLFAANTSDGTKILSDDDGTHVVKGAHPSRSQAAVIRPLGSFNHWYFPRLSIDEESVAHKNVHRVIREMADTDLLLVCGRPDNSSHPAVGWGTTAVIDALYELGGA